MLLDCQELNMKGEGWITQGLCENISNISLRHNSFDNDHTALDLLKNIEVLGVKVFVPF